MAEKIGKRDDVYIFLKSGVRDGRLAALRQRAPRVLQEHPRPRCRSSAARPRQLIALGANSIHMGPMSYLDGRRHRAHHDLSPINRDNDRVSVSLDELKRVIRLWQHEKDATASNPYAELFEYVAPAGDRRGRPGRLALDHAVPRDPRLPRHRRGRVNEIADTLSTATHRTRIRSSARGPPDRAQRARHGSRGASICIPSCTALQRDGPRSARLDQDEAHSRTDRDRQHHRVGEPALFYEMDKDWFYRADERRWIAMNDSSGGAASSRSTARSMRRSSSTSSNAAATRRSLSWIEAAPALAEALSSGGGDRHILRAEAQPLRRDPGHRHRGIEQPPGSPRASRLRSRSGAASQGDHDRPRAGGAASRRARSRGLRRAAGDPVLQLARTEGRCSSAGSTRLMDPSTMRAATTIDRVLAGRRRRAAANSTDEAGVAAGGEGGGSPSARRRSWWCRSFQRQRAAGSHHRHGEALDFSLLRA